MMKRLLSVVLVVVMVFGIVAMAPIHTHAASEMKASDKIIDIIKTMEGFTAVPRWDINQWTVGFGTRCPDEDLERYLAEGIPLEEAHELFMEHLVIFEQEVNAFIERNGLNLNQSQFDAIVSMSYNLGYGFLYNTNHRATRAILNGAEGNELIFAFSVSCTAGGEFLPGLMRRRLMEAVMYLQGIYNQHPTNNYCYVLYDGNGGVRDVVAQGYDCNLTAVPMSEPTYEGHTFLGWYTAPEGGVRITSLDRSMHGMTLYAHWQKGDGSADLPVQPVDGIKVKVTGYSVNIRSGPGTEYGIVGGVTRGDELVITGVCDVDGELWGQFETGWICLRYTNYEEVIAGNGGGGEDDPVDQPQEQLPVIATVIAQDGITIYNGPHTSYPQRGTLKQGDQVEILEYITFMDVRWGRIAGGWVQVNQKLLLHDASLLAHTFQVEVTYASLNVRANPGLNSAVVTKVTKGTVLTLLAVTKIGDVYWGRIEKGWVHLTDYTDFNPVTLPQYQNHSYGNWYVTEKSNCISQGTERRDCRICDHYETRKLPLGNHTMGQWTDIRQATCVTPGQQQRNCQICDYIETRDTQLGDHTMGQWYESLAPTCSTLGQERSDCVYCDHYMTRDVEMLPHSFGPWYETQVPTAEEPGEARRDCQNCEHFETKVLEPTEHVFGEWYVYTAPTCTEPGEERRECTHCELYESRVLEPTGHTVGEWAVYVAPTCTEPGEQRRGCADCDYYESQVLKPTGHTLGNWQVYISPTCTEPGEQRRGCADCDYYESQVLKPTGHTLGNWQVHIAPTCTEPGEQRRTCKNCDYYESKVLQAKGHSLGQWYVYRQSTVSEYGQERRDCADCDYHETRVVEKMPAPVVKVYGTMTNSRYFTLNIRSGAGSGYSAVGKLKYGTTVEILEQKWVSGVLWGRTTAGWVWITDNITLETISVQAPQVQFRMEGNVICDLLNIRSGAGSSYPVMDQLLNGDTVEVLELVTVNGEQWGRVEKGWIRIQGYVALNTYAEEVEDGHLHTYGEWVKVQQADCDTDGVERRNCVYCDHFDVRTTPATGHSYGDWYVYEEATATEPGEERRECKNCDHYECREIPAVGLQTVTKLYATMTNASYDNINIRSGAGSSYSVVGKLKYGTAVEILELKTVSGIVWGRTTVGWVWITGNMTLNEVVTEAETITYKTYGNVVTTSMNIRAGAGTGYAAVGSLKNGAVVEILQIKTVGNSQWGQIQQGWILLTGLVAVSTYAQAEQAQPHTHSYGDWETVKAPTCTESGVQHRECSCGHTEERTVAPVGHSFGDWYVYREATATEDGEERRDCANCAHFESRVIPAKGVETVTKIYGTMTNRNYASLNIRTGPGYDYGVVGKLYYGDRVEILEQKTVDGNVWGRIDKGWVLITGFMTLEEVQEPVESVPPTSSTKVYGTMTNGNFASLNIRTGTSYSHSVVGKLHYGDRVEILETKTVGSDVWGRIEGGWILLTGFVTLETVTQ